LKRIIAIVAALSILLFFSIATATHKEDIKQASVKDIEQVYDIGTTLAVQIKEYAVANNIKSVDELNVKYVGEVRKKELKKKFK
jgi:DNA uptake protein ComE-like DNA-binding protein